MIYSCILFYSLLNGLDPNLTQAVINVESNGKIFAVGKSHGEIGLMQIRPEFVAETKLQLFQPCTNIKVGTRILGKLKQECKMCVDKVFVNSYNLGKRGANKLRHPRLWKYHKKVMLALSEVK